MLNSIIIIKYFIIKEKNNSESLYKYMYIVQKCTNKK